MLWEKDQCIIVVLLITVGYWAILSLNQVYKICKPIIDKQYFNDGLYFVFILCLSYNLPNTSYSVSNYREQVNAFFQFFQTFKLNFSVSLKLICCVIHTQTILRINTNVAGCIIHVCITDNNALGNKSERYFNITLLFRYRGWPYAWRM